MLFSRDWIGEYVELPGDVRELADRLTAAGLSVEAIEPADGDFLLDVDVTTNRPDCMNHLGLAREAAVLLDRELQPPPSVVDAASAPAADAARLVVEDTALCPRYVGLVIRGVEIGPSPEWLRRRLESLGMRSINNVVDVTNYVLWETGQALHAFDLERIGAGDRPLPEVRVRPARPGEKLTTLDGEERELDPEVLVIADAERPIALGGIMGGLDSEVTEGTTRVLLESAHFNPAAVRRGAGKLGLHTDASHRFERGADPEACLWAARRAAALIVEVAGGEVLSGHLEVKELPADWPPSLHLDLGRLERFAGIEIGASEVERILRGLGFELEPEAGDGGPGWRVRVPSWRYYDFEKAYPADLYEEVLRIHGLDGIPSTLPQIAGSDAPESTGHRRRRQIRDHLAACGLAEAINFGFHDRDSDESYPNLLGDRPALALANPLSDLYAVMRRSLLPNLVRSAVYNQRRGVEAVRLFEIGHVFAAGDDDGGEHREEETVALVLGGRLGTPWQREVELDFFDLKGAIESLGDALGVPFEVAAAQRPRLLPGATADVHVEGHPERVVGYLGELEDRDLAYPLFVAELLTAPLEAAVSLETETPSKHPGISVDSTLTHPLEVPWKEIAAAVDAAGVPDLVAFELKDRYQGEGVPEGAVNTTIAFLYTADDRSLTQEEVNERHRRLVDGLESRFGVAGGG
jgi:phenylalanyl-tRNA synthetase beta chain